MNGHDVDEKEGPSNFLPFGQAGWIVNTAKQIKTSKTGQIPETISGVDKDNYQAYKRDTRRIKTVRTYEFVLDIQDSRQEEEKHFPQPSLITRDTQKPRERPSPTQLVHIASGLNAKMAAICAPTATIAKWTLGNKNRLPDIQGAT